MLQRRGITEKGSGGWQQHRDAQPATGPATASGAIDGAYRQSGRYESIYGDMEGSSNMRDQINTKRKPRPSTNTANTCSRVYRNTSSSVYTDFVDNYSTQRLMAGLDSPSGKTN